MARGKTSVWILGDQLLHQHPALAAADSQARDVCVVLVESAARSARLPYQRKKLILLFSAMRHYAAALGERGHLVDYRRSASFAEGLRQHVAEWKPTRLLTIEASEASERAFQQQELADLLGLQVAVLPSTQFLVDRYDPYPDAPPSQKVIMEYFYRRMRQHFGVLMSPDGEPIGGEWNYDAENRKRLPREAEPPPVLRFEPDGITQEVMADVESMGQGIGSVDGFDLAVTRAQARQAFDDFLDHRLAEFGPYEDAMSREHDVLYHSRLSPYLNIGLLEPLELVRAAEHRYRDGRLPINSVEGFVRQVLGWREYIQWQYWRQIPGLLEANAWNAHRQLPDFFWDGNTDMACLASVIGRALRSGYTHHIERLMLICNFCLLAGVEPRLVNEWFLSCYVDAYEWVMAPNVLGMGLNADGGLIATKPYIASANYIHKMGDYCPSCRYDHRKRAGQRACPFNFLYWNFLLQHEARLRANPRLGPSVLNLRYLDGAERQAVRRDASAFLSQLLREDPGTVA